MTPANAPDETAAGSVPGQRTVNAELPAEVVRGFAAGDEAAFSRVYQRYAGPMFTVALRMVGRRDLAADVVQQAFLQAWRAAAALDPDAPIAGWLFTITKRCAIDVWRKENRQQPTAEPEQATPDDAATAPFEDIWEAWQVRSALTRLTSDECDVVRLAYFDGLTQTQIATHLDLPLGTVKSRTGRAHRRLGKLLAHLSPEPTTEVSP